MGQEMMGRLLSLFQRKPDRAHARVVYVTATRRESREYAKRKEATTAALRRYVNEQKLANAVAHQKGLAAVAEALGVEG